MTRMINFYDKYWVKKTSDQLDDFNYKWPVISKLLPNHETFNILDYGCGTGRIFKELYKSNPKSRIHGADISNFAIDKISKKYPKNRFSIVFDGKKLPYRNNYFDYILALDVIEHAVHTNFLLSEFHRILKKNGKLLITTPYYGSLKNVVISIINFEEVFNPYGVHLRFFTNKSLSDGLKRNNLKILSRGYYGRFFPVWRGMFYLCTC